MSHEHITADDIITYMVMVGPVELYETSTKSGYRARWALTWDHTNFEAVFYETWLTGNERTTVAHKMGYFMDGNAALRRAINNLLEACEILTLDFL